MRYVENNGYESWGDSVNLFIIGNGFDIAHGIETEYANFRDFLIENYGYFIYKLLDSKKNLRKEYIHTYPNPYPFPPKRYTDKNWKEYIAICNPLVAALVFWLIERSSIKWEKTSKKEVSKWANLEEILTTFDLESLYKLPYYDTAYDLRDAFFSLRGFIFEWISRIEIPEKKVELPEINAIMKPEEDIALCFNYTETLEKIYGMKSENVCHIHGKRIADKGHKKKDQQYLWMFGEGNEELIIGGPEPENIKDDPFAAVRGVLVKQTDEIIYRNEPFFRRIKNSSIENVYTYGYSFSEVDFPYISEVYNAIKKKDEIKLMCFIHDADDGNNLMKTLYKLNYPGVVGRKFV